MKEGWYSEASGIRMTGPYATAIYAWASLLRKPLLCNPRIWLVKDPP